METQEILDVIAVHRDCAWTSSDAGLVMGCGNPAPQVYTSGTFKEAHIAEMIHKRMTEEVTVTSPMTVTPARVGTLIDALRSMPQGTVVPFLAHMGDSYRGYYERFALLPGEGEARQVADYLEQDVIGHTFTGYKGGEYTMNERTLVHCNEYGRCDGADQVGITSDGTIVFIEDAW
jgi:hypothetical protein